MDRHMIQSSVECATMVTPNGFNITVLTQIELQSLSDTWITPHDQYGDSLCTFAALLVTFEYMATTGFYYIIGLVWNSFHMWNFRTVKWIRRCQSLHQYSGEQMGKISSLGKLSHTIRTSNEMCENTFFSLWKSNYPMNVCNNLINFLLGLKHTDKKLQDGWVAKAVVSMGGRSSFLFSPQMF